MDLVAILGGATLLLGTGGGGGALIMRWWAHRETREGAVDTRYQTLVDELQGQLREQAQAHGEQMRQATEQIHAANESIDRLRGRTDELLKQITTLQTDASEARRARARMHRRYDQLRIECQKRELADAQRISELEGALTLALERVSTYEQLVSEHQALRAEHQQLRADHETLKAEQERLRAMLTPHGGLDADPDPFPASS